MNMILMSVLLFQAVSIGVPTAASPVESETVVLEGRYIGSFERTVFRDCNGQEHWVHNPGVLADAQSKQPKDDPGKTVLVTAEITRGGAYGHMLRYSSAIKVKAVRIGAQNFKDCVGTTGTR